VTTGEETYLPRLNHVAFTMDRSQLDDAGRAEILDFYGEVFGWTEGDNSMESGNPLILYTGEFAQFVYLLPGAAALIIIAVEGRRQGMGHVGTWFVDNLGMAYGITGDIKNVHTVRTGIEYMIELADFYTKLTTSASLGFFQIGGGIAGDFPICVVPMLHQDLQRPEVPLWGYFCQISDSTTSYGSYSGAVPNEKITWGKLGIDTPKHIIESDASIVAPLMFAMILGQ